MKKTYLSITIIFLLILVNELYPQNFWPRVTSPTTKGLNKCCFTDVLNGWAAGDSGVIIHTSNGGISWYIQDSSSLYNIKDLFFVNSRLGWALANDQLSIKTYLIKTTNGGNNWNRSIFFDSSKAFISIYFIDSLNGFIGGWNVSMYKTTNSGLTWFKPTVDTGNFTPYGIYKFTFYNSSAVGLACGGNLDVGGIVCKTTNSGLNWNCGVISPVPLLDLKYLNPNKIVSVGGEYDLSTGLVRSFNAGATWIIDSTFQYFGTATSLAYRNLAEVWIPSGPNWLVSYDSASPGSWREIPIPYSQSIVYCALFADSLNGWAVGNAGGIYKFDTSLIGINPSSRNIPLEFRLYQNYPNPFNPETTIKFEIPFVKADRNATIRIVVYDLLGREIAKLLNQEFKPGTYNIKWDGTGYASGIYFYRLEAGTFTETKKMVLLK
jgi:photosystem II stability/assembly factor-like uncharacterized protein